MTDDVETLRVYRDNALAQRDEAQARLRRVRRTSGRLINDLKTLVEEAYPVMAVGPWKERADAVLSAVADQRPSPATKSVEELELEYARGMEWS